jgi:hypothetical protein
MAPQPPRHQRTTLHRWLRTVTLVGAVVGALLLMATPASAATFTVAAPPGSLDQVIANLRNFLIGLLVGLATLFLTIGGVRYLAADGDPGEVERAKRALHHAAIGYGLAMLAPIIVTALQSLVG